MADQKVVLIIGVSSGIGQAAARLLANMVHCALSLKITRAIHINPDMSGKRPLIKTI